MRIGHLLIFLSRGELVELLYNCGLGGVLHDRSDTLLHSALGCVHLAGADDLAVAGFEVEERLTVLGFFDFETLFHGGILLDGLDSVETSGLGGITFAGENDLAVGGLQVKLEFSVLPESNYKLSHF